MFVNKLAQCAFAICMLNGLVYAADPENGEEKSDFKMAEPESISIRELNNDDDVKEIASRFDFTVVSFYKPSDERSVEVDSFMDGAQNYFNI